MNDIDKITKYQKSLIEKNPRNKGIVDIYEGIKQKIISGKRLKKIEIAKIKINCGVSK